MVRMEKRGPSLTPPFPPGWRKGLAGVALVLGVVLLAGPAMAEGQAQGQPPSQPRAAFSCFGAAQLEDDVFALPFARGSDRLTDAARSGLDAAVALLREQPDRHVCVLGHADRGQGAQTSVELAARRARAVAEALAQRGVARDNIRAEARVGAFSGRGAEPGARAVTVVVMPLAEPVPTAPAGEARR